MMLLVGQLISACQSDGGLLGLEPDRVDYRTAVKGNPLEIPPDLNSTLTKSEALPDNASDDPAQIVNPVLLNQKQAVKTSPALVDVVSEGKNRWLVVRGEAQNQLWDKLRIFWMNNGFNLEVDEPKIGVMETNFAENRAKIESDFIRDGLSRIGLGSLVDALSSSGEKDKYRTRVDTIRTPSGETISEIYIIHKGITQEWTDREKTRLEWRSRENDRTLEGIFLIKLMNHLGINKEQAKEKLSKAAEQNASKEPSDQVVQRIEGQWQLHVNEPFSSAWRTVGTALDRANFTIVSAENATQTYVIRYIPYEQVANDKEKGFFETIFGSKEPTQFEQTLRLMAQSQDASTTRTRWVLLNEDGGPVNDAIAEKVFQQLAVYVRP